MEQRKGSKVIVHGKSYRIVEVRRVDPGLGTRFFGKLVFILSDNDGNQYRYMGKRVAHNSRLTPA